MDTTSLIGRRKEQERLDAAMRLERNVLIEGPVGVGKTHLVLALLRRLGRPYVRVDGDSRFTEQKLTGWFDPALVLKQGYSEATFVEGPLLRAMREGRVLFINELNRMPEAVQNVLLPALDERRLYLPRLGEVSASQGFLVVATQNPREFTATQALSEALLDRFEMLRLDYQSREEEREILLSAWPSGGEAAERVLDVVRATRSHPGIQRGASIRAAQAVGALVQGGLGLREACHMALPGRMEMTSSEEDPLAVIDALLDQNGASDADAEAEKKKI